MMPGTDESVPLHVRRASNCNVHSHMALCLPGKRHGRVHRLDRGIARMCISTLFSQNTGIQGLWCAMLPYRNFIEYDAYISQSRFHLVPTQSLFSKALC